MARWVWFVQIDTERDRHLLWAIVGILGVLVLIVAGLITLAIAV